MTVAAQHTRSGGKFIPELHGMRGVALTLVVVFHLFGNGRVSGGVDVFLVISGYLLTGSLARRLARGEAVSLSDQYSRTFGRLLPAALIVLVFVAIASVVLLPPLRLEGVARQTRASILYYENWELISSSLGYGAASASASPLQHFWSLSVQGQFFLGWPPLLMAVFWLSKKTHRRAYSILVPLVGILTVLSFGFAIWMVAADQSVAYFHSLSRFWELGIGAFFALTSHRFVIADRWKPVALWLGFALVVSCGFVVNGKYVFPGPWALWPSLGILLVILGSGTPTRSGLLRLLEVRPVKFLADISYPMYLWHWPLLVFYLYYRGFDQLGWRSAAALLVVSIVLSWLTRRLLELPVQRILPRFAPKVALIGVVAVLAVSGGGSAMAVAKLESDVTRELGSLAEDSPDHPGAVALTDGSASHVWETPPRPSTAAAGRDVPSIYSRRCIQNWRDAVFFEQVLICDDTTKTNPRHKVVMSGGSHILQWYPAMKVIADQENWELVVIDKDGCRLSSNSAEISANGACGAWNSRALDVIIGMKPDVVFTVGTETPGRFTGEETFFKGQGDAWRTLIDSGIPVAAIRDTPRFTENVPECLEGHPHEPSQCSRKRQDIFLPISPALGAVGAPESVVHVDMTDSFCTDVCEPVIGNVVVYRDRNHMTATYARTTAPALREKLREQVPSLF
ncbi:acyltransferase family protein [Tessaracoccus sp.]